MSSQTKIIYVGGLSYQTTEEMLEKVFHEFGEILEITLPRRDDDRIKGFAYIRFASPEQAKAALKKDESTLDGRIIGVELYRARRKFAPRRTSDNDYRRKEEKPKKKKSHHHHHHHHHHKSSKKKDDDDYDEGSDDYDSKKNIVMDVKEEKKKIKSEKRHKHHHHKDKKKSKKKKSSDYSE